MFMSSIRRWHSGLIAAVRMVSSIGRLLLVEGTHVERSSLHDAAAETLSPHRAVLNQGMTPGLYPFPRSGFVQPPDPLVWSRPKLADQCRARAL